MQQQDKAGTTSQATRKCPFSTAQPPKDRCTRAALVSKRDFTAQRTANPPFYHLVRPWTRSKSSTSRTHTKGTPMTVTSVSQRTTPSSLAARAPKTSAASCRQLRTTMLKLGRGLSWPPRRRCKAAILESRTKSKKAIKVASSPSTSTTSTSTSILRSSTSGTARSSGVWARWSQTIGRPTSFQNVSRLTCPIFSTNCSK